MYVENIVKEKTVGFNTIEYSIKKKVKDKSDYAYLC